MITAGAATAAAAASFTPASSTAVGTARPHHLTAAELKLSAAETTRLEEHCTTRPASGF
ncbi:hypothetical protein [Streptomyces sp. NPDC001933]|uniref:hypothetical protein n=1 Tax=Streptomyces sp. NPDC001933 TaxID=3364626 RepID=UPI0036B01187